MRFYILIVLFALIAVAAAQGRRPQRGGRPNGQQPGPPGRPQWGLPPNGTLPDNGNSTTTTTTTTTEASSTDDSSTTEASSS
ncbi:bromodomain-containing protein DDB_G0270170-like [Drosophila miranda]|uniref:bromodomain-containing protein DDB_G0270170-like n=1 Tax=Drosophila miranda TaxID=7229 RepID=UPI0007E88E03|nr:bromodomain-containing protein DDB_G0270170-like [Drosophila miranda]